MILNIIARKIRVLVIQRKIDKVLAAAEKKLGKSIFKRRRFQNSTLSQNLAKVIIQASDNRRKGGRRAA